MPEPRVTVVMPVRNGAAHVGEAVESILAQTLRDLELVVIDDGSTDETAEIIGRYAARDGRIRAERQSGAGVIAALNFGCRLARAPWIARMDADDVSSPERLERQLDYLDSHPEVALLGTAYTVVDEAGRVLGTTVYPTDPDDVARRLPVKNCLAHPSVVLSRAVFEEVGGYRRALRHAEDYDLWLRIGDRHAIANLAEPLLTYRLHPESVSLRNLRQQVLSRLAAQAATGVRRAGMDDGLWDVEQVTPEVLERLGVSRAEVERNVFSTCSAHAESALALGHDLLALDLTREALACALRLSRAERAHVHRIAALAAFRQRMRLRATRSVIAGVAARPSLAAGVVRHAARRLTSRSADTTG